MSDNIIERMARAQYEAEVNRWPQYASGFQKWEDVGPETKDRFRFAARAAYAIARRAALEEAAKVAEAFPARKHGNLATAPYAAAEQAADEIAAAIRKLAGEA